MMTVAANIVTWNGRRFLPALLRSLENQTVQPKRILIIDNGSVDGTIEYLREWPKIHVIRNNRNLGFAHGHNQGIALSDADAVLLVNQDLILDPRCIEQLVRELVDHPNIASVCPKVKRFTLNSGDLSEPVLTDTIDATGMILRRNRQAANLGEGRPDDGSFDQPAEYFGAPGVLPLYRKSALNDVAIGPNEWFDDDFTAYKEDVDLAWRLRWAGWGSRYAPKALAYHHRTLTHHGDEIKNVIRTRRQRSPLLNMLSYRNHLLMLLKNERSGTFFPHLPYILLYEIRRLGYLLLREWSTLKAWPQVWRLLPSMIRKRRQTKRRIGATEFRRLVSP